MNDFLSLEKPHPEPLQIPSLSEIRLKILLLHLKERREKGKNTPAVEDYLSSQNRSAVLASDIAEFGRYNYGHVKNEGGKKPQGQLP